MSKTTLTRCLCLAVALTTSGCASFLVTDAQKLSPAQLEPVGADTISRGGYRFGQFPISPDAPDLFAMVAISGGGKRSASYGYGALKGMREVMLQTRAGPRPLLDQIDVISGVSGGSFTASYYGMYHDKAFGQFETDFLYNDTNSNVYGIFLLPWNWAWFVSPGIGTNDFMERVYDRHMFHGATFADLAAQGRPQIVIGATDISYGTPFVFTQDMFDLICSDMSVFPVARAVAASAGFPGLFSPITLTNNAKDCGGRTPGWLRRITPAERHNPLSRVGAEAIRAERYLDADRTRYVHLSDGGVADNLAMRTQGSMMQVMSAADLRARGLTHVRRVLLLSIDGQGSQDTSIAQRREVGGLLALFGLVSGGLIDRYNFETLYTVNHQIEILERNLREARCAEAPVIDGARCDDVQTALLHIALADRPDSPETARLQAIPTSLTLEREDVDLLVTAGRDAVTGSAPLRAFLDNYPPAPLPAPGIAAGGGGRESHASLAGPSMP